MSTWLTSKGSKGSVPVNIYLVASSLAISSAAPNMAPLWSLAALIWPSQFVSSCWYRPSKIICSTQRVCERPLAAYLSILGSKARFCVYLYTYDVMLSRHQINWHVAIYDVGRGSKEKTLLLRDKWWHFCCLDSMPIDALCLQEGGWSSQWDRVRLCPKPGANHKEPQQIYIRAN